MQKVVEKRDVRFLSILIEDSRCELKSGLLLSIAACIVDVKTGIVISEFLALCPLTSDNPNKIPISDYTPGDEDVPLEIWDAFPVELQPEKWRNPTPHPSSNKSPNSEFDYDYEGSYDEKEEEIRRPTYKDIYTEARRGKKLVTPCDALEQFTHWVYQNHFGVNIFIVDTPWRVLSRLHYELSIHGLYHTHKASSFRSMRSLDVSTYISGILRKPIISSSSDFFDTKTLIQNLSSGIRRTISFNVYDQLQINHFDLRTHARYHAVSTMIVYRLAMQYQMENESTKNRKCTLDDANLQVLRTNKF